jgi:predicted N-acetyltransferase YhbS
VATTRFDKINEITAVIRLVAVTKSMQGTRLGRILMERTAFLARTRGYARIVVNAASSAIGFYKRVGFLEEIWDPAELPGNAIATTQMALYLEGSRNTD